MASKGGRARTVHTAKKNVSEAQETSLTMTDVFKLVCVQFGIVTVPYYMDEMKPYELKVILDSLHLRIKDDWEQARLIAYMVAQVNSRKKLRPTDIIKFGWENETSTPKTESRPMDEKQYRELMIIAKEREKV